MRLIPCPTCGTGLDEEAPICSRCSRPDPFGANKKSVIQIKLFVIIAVIAALGYGYFFAFPEFFSMFKQ